MFVGVTDEGDIVGIQESWDLLRQRIENAIADRIIGHVKVNFIPYTITGHGDKEILEVRVTEAEDKPIALRDGSRERYYLRRDGTYRIMKRDDWVHLFHTERPVQLVQSSPTRFP